MNKVFWSIAALEAVFFVVAFFLTATEGGQNPDGGKGMALVFQIALPFLVLAVVSLIYWKTGSQALHIVLLIAVTIPVVVLAGQWLRGPMMDRDIAVGGYLYKDAKMKKFVAAVANLDSQKVREMAPSIDVNLPGENGETPLIFAIEKAGSDPRRTEMIRLLLSLGAKPDSALPRAYASNNAAIVDLLLGGGANPNYKDEEGTPAFFYGLTAGGALVRKGTDFNARDAKGETILIRAATFSNWQAVLTFLALGVKDVPTPSGKTAASMVKQAIADDKQNSRETSPTLRELDSKLNH